MIGLGSNKMSVCRRGGMRVTQAGRGGMEWLAGGRMPSWATPYSAQATAALKAQFPTQWPTIRDYGFAHPALVPFINEDPMVICSVGLQSQGVDLPHRYLIGDGTSYLRTSVLIKTNSVFAIEFYNAASSISGYPGIFGSGTAWNATNAAWLGLPENAYGKVALWINGGDWPNCVTGTVYSNYSDILECTDIKISGFKCKNLTTGATSTASSGKTSIQGTVPMQIFGYSSNGTSVANKGFAIAYWQHIGDTNNRLLPIILGKARTADQVYPSSKGAQAVGTKGMIDIETGLFHPNANSSGSFTIGYKKYENGQWVTWSPS